MEPVASIAARVAAGSYVAGRRRPAKVRKPARVSKPARRTDVSRPSTEYSCKIDISLSVDFEGEAVQKHLLKRLQDELLAAIQAGVKATARAQGLTATNVILKPIQVDCAVNDASSVEDDLAIEIEEPEPEPEAPPARRRRR